MIPLMALEENLSLPLPALVGPSIWHNSSLNLHDLHPLVFFPFFKRTSILGFRSFPETINLVTSSRLFQIRSHTWVLSGHIVLRSTIQSTRGSWHVSIWLSDVGKNGHSLFIIYGLRLSISLCFIKT